MRAGARDRQRAPSSVADRADMRVHARKHASKHVLSRWTLRLISRPRSRSQCSRISSESATSTSARCLCTSRKAQLRICSVISPTPRTGAAVRATLLGAAGSSCNGPVASRGRAAWCVVGSLDELPDAPPPAVAHPRAVLGPPCSVAPVSASASSSSPSSDESSMSPRSPSASLSAPAPPARPPSSESQSASSDSSASGRMRGRAKRPWPRSVPDTCATCAAQDETRRSAGA